MPIKKTEEEKRIEEERARQEQATKEGNAFIQSREKLASRQGTTSKRAQEQIVAAGGLPENVQTSVQQKQQQATNIAGQLAEAGVFNPLPTQQTDLSAPSALSKEGVLAINQQINEEGIFRKIYDNLDNKADIQLNKLPSPVANALILIKGREKVFRRFSDTADISIFAARAGTEAGGKIPIVGDILSGIFGSRTQKVSNIASSITTKDEEVGNIVSAANSGVINSYDAFEVLNKMETQLEIDESDIQREVIGSPVLRRSEELRKIQEDILKLRQHIFVARQQIAGIVVGETDNANIAATLENLKSKLGDGEIYYKISNG
jgi:hypothetical protein